MSKKKRAGKVKNNKTVYLAVGAAAILALGFLVWRRGEEVGINQVIPVTGGTIYPLSTASPKTRPSTSSNRVTVTGTVSKNSSGMYFLTTTAGQSYILVNGIQSVPAEPATPSGRPIPQPLGPTADRDPIFIDLEQYVGKKVSVTGPVAGDVLTVERIRRVY